jgi:uncharacterized protein (DUF4415 family)
MSKSPKPLTEVDLTDPDNPEWTKADFARAQPPEVFPDIMEALRRKGGRPPKADKKVPVSLRLDAKVVEHFKQTGQGWQSRINELLATLIANGRA